MRNLILAVFAMLITSLAFAGDITRPDLTIKVHSVEGKGTCCATADISVYGDGGGEIFRGRVRMGSCCSGLIRIDNPVDSTPFFTDEKSFSAISKEEQRAVVTELLSSLK